MAVFEGLVGEAAWSAESLSSSPVSLMSVCQSEGVVTRGGGHTVLCGSRTHSLLDGGDFHTHPLKISPQNFTSL